MEEIFEIYNERNELVGTAPREEVHSKGLFHRGVNIFVVNSKGEVFLEKRSRKKDTLPGYWDFVGEHLKPGETFEQAAIRGLKEELGLKARVKMIRNVRFFHFTYPNGKIDREFDCLFICRVPFTSDVRTGKPAGFTAVNHGVSLRMCVSEVGIEEFPVRGGSSNGPFKLDKEEVEEGKFFPIDWIEKEIKNGKRKFGYFFLAELPDLKKYLGI